MGTKTQTNHCHSAVGWLLAVDSYPLPGSLALCLHLPTKATYYLNPGVGVHGVVFARNMIVDEKREKNDVLLDTHAMTEDH